MHRVVVLIERATGVIGSGERDGPLPREVHLQNGIDDQQHGVAAVALDVQVVQVLDICKVVLDILLLVAFPGVEAEVLGIEHEAAELAEVELGLRLDAESTTHVVVALDDVEIVALGSAEQDAAEEHALFQLRQASHLGE